MRAGCLIGSGLRLGLNASRHEMPHQCRRRVHCRLRHPAAFVALSSCSMMGGGSRLLVSSICYAIFVRPPWIRSARLRWACCRVLCGTTIPKNLGSWFHPGIGPSSRGGRLFFEGRPKRKEFHFSPAKLKFRIVTFEHPSHFQEGIAKYYGQQRQTKREEETQAAQGNAEAIKPWQIRQRTPIQIEF